MGTHSEPEIIILEPEDFVVVEEATETIDLSYLGSRDHSKFEAEIIRLTNRERANYNLHPLTQNDLLTQAALAQALDMAENHFISHTGSDNSKVNDRVTHTGYKWIVVGENLAMGQRLPEEAVQGWMNSPGHRANVLNDKFYEIGVAYIEGDIIASDGTAWRGGYWVQNFGARRSWDHLAPVTVRLIKDAVSAVIKPKEDDLEIVILDEN